MDRRDFLKGTCAAAATALSPFALAVDAVDRPRRLRGAPDRASFKAGGPLELPEWSYGKNSTASDAMLMFRGNPSHTFYGTGPLPSKPRIKWRHRMLDFESLYYGRPHVWRGTGWTGQAAKLGDFVFIASQGGHLYAFEAQTGRLRWRFAGGRMFKSSVCLYDNHVYVGNVDNHLRCLDAKTGDVAWKLRWSRDLDSSACVVNDRLYIAGESGYARCIDPKTGELHWKTFVDGINRGSKGGSYGSETSPAVHEGEYYCATYDGLLFSLNASDGSMRWKAVTGDDTDASPVVYDDRVFIAAEDNYSFMQCFRRSDGKKVWEQKAKGGFWATPAVSEETVYIPSGGGDMLALDARSGKTLWHRQLGTASWSSPVVLEDKILFGAFDGKLRCLDRKTGKDIWELKLGGRIHSTPCVVDGVIYIGTRAGRFYAIGD
jgi:outer membrane protein assembly factor BamB